MLFNHRSAAAVIRLLFFLFHNKPQNSVCPHRRRGRPRAMRTFFPRRYGSVFFCGTKHHKKSWQSHLHLFVYNCVKIRAFFCGHLTCFQKEFFFVSKFTPRQQYHDKHNRRQPQSSVRRPQQQHQQPAANKNAKKNESTNMLTSATS